MDTGFNWGLANNFMSKGRTIFGGSLASPSVFIFWSFVGKGWRV